MTRAPGDRYPDGQAALHELRALLEARGVGDPRLALAQFLAIDDPEDLAAAAVGFIVEPTLPAPRVGRRATFRKALGPVALVAVGLCGGLLYWRTHPGRVQHPVLSVQTPPAPPPPSAIQPAIHEPIAVEAPPAPPASEQPEVTLTLPTPPDPPRPSTPAPAERHPTRSHYPGRSRHLAEATQPARQEPGAAVRSGEIDVWVTPWADAIAVDGSNRGTGRPPPLKLSLPAGKHTLRITNPHLKALDSPVEVTAGRTLRLRVDLQAGTMEQSK